MNNMQEIIVNEMKVQPEIDVKATIEEIKYFIKSYVTSHSFIQTLVLGISGGQDSTLVGKLAQMAVNELNENGDKHYQFTVSYTHLTLPTTSIECRSRWSPYH